MRAAIPWIAEASSAATLPATAITTATLPATLHAGRGQFVIPFGAVCYPFRNSAYQRCISA